MRRAHIGVYAPFDIVERLTEMAKKQGVSFNALIVGYLAGMAGLPVPEDGRKRPKA